MQKQIEKVFDEDVYNINNENINENSLIDVEDRIRILKCMRDDFDEKDFMRWVSNLSGLFCHIDNIRFVYDTLAPKYNNVMLQPSEYADFKPVQLPEWFKTKYGEKFAKDKN
jgi:hypothetical protein